MSRRIAGILAVLGLSANCESDDIVGNRGILPSPPASSQVATVVVTPETSLRTVAGGRHGLVIRSHHRHRAGLVRVTAVSEGRTGAATVTSVR